MKKRNENTKYHIQRVIIRAVEKANDNLVLARDALDLLQLKHPKGLDGGWSALDLEQLQIRLDDALKDTGEFFHWIS